MIHDTKRQSPSCCVLLGLVHGPYINWWVFRVVKKRTVELKKKTIMVDSKKKKMTEW